MRTSELLLALVLITTLCGCSSTQWVGHSAEVYDIKLGPAGGVSDDITQYRPDHWTKAIVTVKEDQVKVKVAAANLGHLKPVATVNTALGAGASYSLPSQFIFPEGRYNLKAKDHLVYNEGQMFLQPMTIALKFRREAIKDTIPAQTESGFNAGLVFGYKVSKIFWRENKNAFNSNTTRYGLAAGVFASIGASDLTVANTRDPVIALPRKVPVLSYGVMASINLNGIHLGIARAWDRAIGNATDSWVYQGKPWTGVIIGLDIIK